MKKLSAFSYQFTTSFQRSADSYQLLIESLLKAVSWKLRAAAGGGLL